MTPPASLPPSPLGGDHPDATQLHKLLEKRMEYLRQHPQYIQPVLQRRGERVRWEDADAEDGNNEANEVRELVEALVFGPPNAKVGAWFRDGQVEDPETVKSICKIRAGLLYLLVQHDQWREVDDLLRRLAVTFRLVGLESWKWDVQHQTLVDLLNLLASTWVLCVPRDGVIPDLPPPSCDEKKKVPAFVRLLLCVGHLREYLLGSLVRGNVPFPSSKFPRGLVESLLKHSIFERFDASLLQSSRRTWLEKAFPTSYALRQEKKEQEKKTSPSFPFPNSSLPAPSSSFSHYFSISDGAEKPLPYFPARPEALREIEAELNLSPLDLPDPREPWERLPYVDERGYMKSPEVPDYMRFAPLPPLDSPHAVSGKDDSFAPPPDREVAQAERTLFCGFDSYLTSERQPLSHQQRTDPSKHVLNFGTKRKWTEEEDRKLKEAKKAGKRWGEMETDFESRSIKGAQTRWTQLQKKDRGEKAALKTPAWTAEMDSLLIQKVYPFHDSAERVPWTQITQEINAELNISRSSDAYRSRWRHSLSPGLDKKPVTEREKQRIAEMLLRDENTSFEEIKKEIPRLAGMPLPNLHATVRRIKEMISLQRLSEGKGEQTQ
mmetsp:Transcript_25680/g.64575  ORF Transcript_25680/g.64575 Transcript_25680/m.64575 type:complete len:606 (-) Transcript_25680:1197-3014(-)|eukprot:CAMPEP_0113917810 /NCGR_PEP_ID=MMETSP0780_2-20120614/32954_1 /TAXON_ID=652834 /ORGANISM="Palpitomonas bilix" /LENGTH=605 /DNA_ID=CAMNT_0000917451 /DNA_START=1231 /DNA_END=3048 /DNA_ORIENTATION=- /assembly_acc=CAM_ASM_000599